MWGFPSKNTDKISIYRRFQNILYFTAPPEMIDTGLDVNHCLFHDEHNPGRLSLFRVYRRFLERLIYFFIFCRYVSRISSFFVSYLVHIVCKGMRYFSSKWPGLCLLFSTFVCCQAVELIWTFLFHIFQSPLPPVEYYPLSDSTPRHSFHRKIALYQTNTDFVDYWGGHGTHCAGSILGSTQ